MRGEKMEKARGDRNTLIRSDAWRQKEKLPTGENEKGKAKLSF
jgi:hypothetical protein